MTNPHKKMAPHRPWGATVEEPSPGTASTLSIPGTTPISTARAAGGSHGKSSPSLFDQLHELVGPEHRGMLNRVVTHAYLLGRASGIEDARSARIAGNGYALGYSDAVAALTEAGAQRDRAIVATALASMPYSALCDLRGDVERAERARALEQRIESMPSPSEDGGWLE